MVVQPVLKWAGGKRQLLDELYSRFPEEYENYHEPFFGGGTLFFDIEPRGGTINDTNIRLVNFYEQIRDQPQALINLLRSFNDPEAEADANREYADENHKGREIKNYYYQQRALFNRRPYADKYDPLEEAALLLYLNRTCYNGLYRENNSGGFNAPIGQHANPDWVQEDRIREASQVLENTEILNTDFEYIHNHVSEDDLVYFDPPYEPMSPTANFNNYSGAGFDTDDQKRLIETAKELGERGVYVILSNSGVMYDMYDEAGFNVVIERATRAINSDSQNRDEVEEIIATNIPESAQQGAGQKSITEF